MLPGEEELDEALKTFLLRCACGPPSIFHDSQTRLCSMDGLCTAILKSKNLPFLPHWEQKEFQKRVGWFQGYQGRRALSSTASLTLPSFCFIGIKKNIVSNANDKIKSSNITVPWKHHFFMSEDVLESHGRWFKLWRHPGLAGHGLQL